MRNEYDTGSPNSGIEAPQNDWWRRGVRTAIQLIAGGGLAALTDQIITDIDATYAVYVTAAYSFIVALAQNFAEQQGWVPSVLKAKATPRR